MIDLGVNHGLVDKAGAWYSYQGDRIGQGKENSRQFLLDHPEIASDIEKRLRAALLPSAEDKKKAAEEAAKEASRQVVRETSGK